MDIIAQTFLSKVFEYFFSNWRNDMLIALVTGFSVYFVMKYKYRYAVFYYENLLDKYSKRLDHIMKNLNELKQIVVQMNKEDEKKIFLEQIEKIIEEKIQKDNVNKAP